MNDMSPDRIRVVLQVMGCRVPRLAATLGISRSAIYQWLAGDTQPTAKHLDRIAEVSGIDRDWLADDGPVTGPPPLRTTVAAMYDGQGGDTVELTTQPDVLELLAAIVAALRSGRMTQDDLRLIHAIVSRLVKQH